MGRRRQLTSGRPRRRVGRTVTAVACTATAALLTTTVATLTPATATPQATAAPAVSAASNTAGSCETGGISYTPIGAAPNTFSTLPPWADGSGWSHPSQYRSIVSGDVDGDGNGELVGRNGSTVEVWTWAPALPAPTIGTKAYNPRPGQWTQVIPNDPPGSTTPVVDFAESSGWWDPSRYWTFRLAAVTGRTGTAGPAQDLVYRTSTGLQVRTWNASVGTWNDPITQGTNNGGQPWSDANGWGQSHPERFRTITTGNVDGNPGDEIIANGPNGIETWGYDAGSGQLQRLDTAPGNVNVNFDPAPKTWTSGDADLYLTLRLANIDGDAQGTAELVVRDRTLGLRAFTFGPLNGVGTGWWELSGANPPTNGWTDANGWNDPLVYPNISVGDLDGNGTADLVGRGQAGVEAWTYANGQWSLMAPVFGDWAGGTGVPGNGFEYPQYTATFQTADVLTTASDPVLPGADQVIIKGGSGMGAAYLVATPGAPQPFAWKGSSQSIYAFADGYGWSPPGTPVSTHGLDDASDLYYSTIRAVTTQTGQPEVVIGRNATGVWTTSMYPNANPGAGAPLSGHSASAPFPTYTDLSAIGDVALPPTGAPSPDLSKLTPAGRAYWGLDLAVGRDKWPQANQGWTILDQFATASGQLPDSALLRPSYGPTTYLPDGTPVQQIQPPYYEPPGSYTALNVDRDTYDSVGNDMADWVTAVNDVRTKIYGSQGLKALVLAAFVVNQNTVSQVQGAFESNPRLRAALSDLLWGFIGALLPVGAAFFEIGGPIAAMIALDSSVLGSAVSATWGTADPNASVEDFANNLQQRITDAFCSVNDRLDANYQQIVGDYGLLLSNSRMIERSQQAASYFSTTTANASQQLQSWTWQQFANRPPGDKVENWWLGYCTDGANGCPWGPSDQGVWTSPENPKVTYRIVGESKNGSEANCSYGMQHHILDGDKGNEAKQAWIDAFSVTSSPPPPATSYGVGPPGADVAAPRKTDKTTIGSPVGADGARIDANAGISGWNLGTQKCN